MRILNLNHKNGIGTAGRQQQLRSLGYGEGTKGNIFPLYSNILKGNIDINLFDVRCFNCNILYEYLQGRRKYPEGFSFKLSEIPAEEVTR